MGNYLGLRKKQVRVFMFGIGSPGSTTILYRMITPQGQLNTVPTTGFNMEKVSCRNIDFTFFDVSGGYQTRLTWRHYLAGASVLVAVVDSTDLSKQEEFQACLSCVMPYLPNKDVPFLIIANKIDMCKHTDEEILQYVGVSQYGNQVKYHIIHTNALSGEGVQEGLNWLVDQSQTSKPKK